MLVLARRNQQSVVIGASGDMEEMVRVKVLEICGGTVKLGFEANEDVAVYRQEVWERIRAETQAPPPALISDVPKNRVPYLD